MDTYLDEANDVLRARAYVAARAREIGLTVREYLRSRAERRILRERAAYLGLAYWPALYQRGVDPHAFLAAEQVLAAKVGSRWGDILPDGSMSHGGWDSWSVYGLSANDVAQMWYASGCRNNAKFRFQVASGIVAKKGDSLPWLRNYLRGKRWLESRRLWWGFSRKAIAAIGRLSPEARWAAIEGVNLLNGTIRIRDLNWVAVKRVEEQFRGAVVPRVRAALLLDKRPKRAMQLLGHPDNLAAALAPAFPKLPVDLARRIALGESPVQLAGGLLSKKEAHAWATDGAPGDIVRWLTQYLRLPVSHRSLKVIRWLAHCRDSGRWAALERERTARLPGGGERTFTVLSILEHLQEEDIETGRDSVEAVLRRAARRLGDAWLTAQMADHRVLAPLPAWAGSLPRWMRILRTPAELAREGKEMRHCVGGYVDAVEKGQCHILAIASRHGRSTVELRPNLEVAQHRGAENYAPPGRHVTLLRAFLARLKKGEEHV